MQKFVIILVAIALLVPIGALGLSAALGGDDGSDTADGASRSAVATVDPASQPSASPTTAPKAPQGRDRQTAAGAEASVRSLLESYAYMMATGDTDAWERQVSPDCQVCVQFVANAKALHSQGGYGVGGEFTLDDLSFAATGDKDTPTAGTVTVTFTEAPQTIIASPTTAPQTQQEISGTMKALVSWDGERWRITDLSIEQAAQQ